MTESRIGAVIDRVSLKHLAESENKKCLKQTNKQVNKQTSHSGRKEFQRHRGSLKELPVGKAGII